MLKSILNDLRGAPPARYGTTNAAPAGVWMWLPLGALVVTFALKAWDEAAFVWWIRDELGPGENLTAGLFFASVVLAIMIGRTLRRDGIKAFGAAFYVLAGAAFFVGGEEMSWGQHIFRWATPEWVGAVNKQNETNLHNMAERVLDQKPRAIVSLIILLFGAVVPFLLRSGRLQRLNGFPLFVWLLPRVTLAPAALSVFLPRMLDRATVLFGAVPPFPFDLTTRHHQELQELMISIALFIYLLDLLRRVRAVRVMQVQPA